VTERRSREASFRARIDSQDVIAQFAELLLLGEDPDHFLPSAARLIARELGMPLVTLASLSRDGTEIEMRAVAGSLAEQDPALCWGRHYVPATSATRAAHETGRAISVEDFESRGAYRPGRIARAAGARSVACVPFADGAGCLAVISPDSCAIDADAVALLETVGRLLSTRWPV
jgi:GAF domain-containing protein